MTTRSLDLQAKGGLSPQQAMSKCALGVRDRDQEEVPYVYSVKFSLQFIEEIVVVGNVHLKHKADFLKSAIDRLAPMS